MEPVALGGIRRRVGVAVIDQTLSAGSNVMIAVVAARLLGASEFGVFGVTYLIYVISTGIIRAMVGEPALVRSHENPHWRDQPCWLAESRSDSPRPFSVLRMALYWGVGTSSSAHAGR